MPIWRISFWKQSRFDAAQRPIIIDLACSVSVFIPRVRSYELEYDENRLEIGWDIARRYLGIERAQNTNAHNRITNNDDIIDNNQTQTTETAQTNALDANDESSTNAKTVAHETTNSVLTNAPKNAADANTDTSNNLMGLSNQGKVAGDNAGRKNEIQECGKEELVLDILNDDLIEKVRVKIPCKHRTQTQKGATGE